MKTKNCSAAIALACIAAFSGSGSAALLIHEPFDYASTAPVNNGASLGDGAQPGGFGLGTWSQANSGSNEIDVADGGVSFTDAGGNVLPVSGNAFERAQRVGQAAVNSPITASGFTADNTSIWMTFLYQDRGFSGPDFGIALTSQPMNFGDAQALTAAGFGVGVGINSVGGPERALGAIVYNNTTAQSFTPEPGPAPFSFNGPGASDVHLLGMRVNWNESGTLDEVFVFDITDITTEPAEGDAIASATFDWTQAEQDSLSILGINESQVNFLDEIRVATTFAEAVGIPEPSAALLGVFGVLLVLRRRKG